MGARYGSFDVFGVTGEVLVPYRLLTSSRVNIMTTSATVTLGGAILPVYTPSEKHSVGPVLSRITKSELYTTYVGLSGTLLGGRAVAVVVCRIRQWPVVIGAANVETSLYTFPNHTHCKNRGCNIIRGLPEHKTCYIRIL